MVALKHLLTWIYHSFKQATGPSYETETSTYISRVEADGGVVPKKGILNEWVKLLKNNSLYTGLTLSLGASYGHKKDGSSNVSKIYDLKGGDASQATLAQQAVWADNIQNAKPAFSFPDANTRFYRGVSSAGTNPKDVTVYFVLQADDAARSTIFGLQSSSSGTTPYNQLEISAFKDDTGDPLQIYRSNGSGGFYNRSVTDSVADNDAVLVGMVRLKADGEWTLRTWYSSSSTDGDWGFMEPVSYTTAYADYILGNRGASNQFKGKYFEVHCFNAYHADTQANIVLEWLRDRYFTAETISDSASGSNAVTTPAPDPVEEGEVWVTQSHIYNSSLDRIEANWTLHTSTIPAQDMLVSITHSSTVNGQPENYTWTIPAGQSSVGAVYNYPVASMGVTDLIFRANPGTGYTLPDTITKPDEVSINIDTATGGSGGGTAVFKLALTVPSHDSIVWESRMENGLAFTNNVAIVENRNFRSTDPGKGAVELWSDYAGKTIIFRNCKFSYQGWAGIKAIDSIKGELIVENCMFYGRDSAVSGVPRYAVRGQFFKGIRMEHCYVENSGGLLCAVNAGSVGAAYYEYIHFRFNKLVNINGMMGTQANIVQTHQINDSTVGSNIDIDTRWNETFNTDGLTHVEDNYNYYCASGTKANPARVEFNMVQGAFYKTRGANYTGGGIILDSPNGAQIASHYEVNWNVMIGVGNYCLGVASAKNVNRRGNRGVVACQYPDGTRYQFHTSGMWISDYYSRNETYNILDDGNAMGIENGDSSRTATRHYNNIVNPNGDLPGIMRNNYYLTDGTLSSDITLATESNELARWNMMKQANGVVCGPYTETTGTLPGAPVVSSLSANTGKHGDKVTITGSNFSRSTAVKFGTANAITFCVVSDTQIDAFVAAGATGAVTVTNPTGTGTGPTFTHTTAAPTISNVSPLSGVTGAKVVITGTNLTFATAVRLGTNTLSDFRRINDSTIWFNVPGIAAGSYQVQVENPYGSAIASQNFQKT